MSPARKKALRGVVRAALVVCVASFVAVLVRRFTLAFDKTVVADGQIGIRYWEVARNSFLRGDGFPLWDRSACAGHPFLGNPETQLLSSLVAGVFRIHGDTMQRWYPTVGAALGVIGVYAWCRRALLVSAIPALFAGALFVASGFLSLHSAVRMTFVPFVLIPWALLFARLGEKDLRYAVGLGTVLAVMMLEAGIYPFCFALVALLAIELPRIVSKDAGPIAIGRLAIIAMVVFFLLAAIKIFPVMAQLARAPRAFVDRDAGALTDLIPMLGDSDRGSMPGRNYHINEYRSYIGPLAFGMGIAGAGVALILKPRRFDVALLLLVSMLLVRGRYSETSAWALLTAIPPFNQLQVPSRFVVLVSLAIAAAAAIALDAAMVAVKSKPLVALLFVIGLLALYDPIGAGQKALKANTTDPWLPRPDPKAGPYHLVSGDDFHRAAEYPARNVGTPACYKSWSYPEGRDYAINGPPVTLLGEPPPKVEITQDAYEIDPTNRAANTLSFQQTFDPDWQTSHGTVRRGARGNLEVSLPGAGQHLRVFYRPRGILSGLVSLATFVLAGLGFAGWVAWRKRARLRAAAASPAPAASPPG